MGKLSRSLALALALCVLGATLVVSQQTDARADTRPTTCTTSEYDTGPLAKAAYEADCGQPFEETVAFRCDWVDTGFACSGPGTSTQLPEVAPDPAPAGVPDNNTVIVGHNPGDATCIDFGSQALNFGEVNQSHWEEWVPGLRNSTREQFLAVEVDQDGRSNLRHQYVPWENGSERVLMSADLEDHDTYRITESVFFEPGWEWGGENRQGGKLGFGFGGGSLPTGGDVEPDGFTARIMWRGNRLSNGNFDGTGRFALYSYAADRSGQFGEDFYARDFNVPVGEWIQITYEVSTNSELNNADGHVRMWIDGELHVDNRGMQWQAEAFEGDSDPKIDRLLYSSFYGGGTSDWAPSKTTYSKSRDVCWAPVVDGYSGIDPDNGRTYVDPTTVRTSD